jgi:D-alanyl-D-alanine carboxypeptidase (penicillin-binding protein 5/6)
VRQPASITKVMTALLVLETVAEDADVSGETVHVSTRAGTETGSSAGLRPGDRVTVGELLYGLLLPSGNDAAVALAEHFGPRLVDSEDSAHDRFVAAMNARAVALGLKATKFGNPHGKTEEGCGSSPRDVADLVRAALSFPAFREIVSSREHIASLENDAGYTRPVVWRNTNRLLGIDGFLGVKTGTTFAAGCCLAACEQRDGRELIVVVLGSSSTEARYCDARNLFRYGWRQLRSRP